MTYRCNSYCEVSAFVKAGYCNAAAVPSIAAAAKILAPAKRLLYVGCSGVLTPFFKGEQQAREFEPELHKNEFSDLLRKQGD